MKNQTVVKIDDCDWDIRVNPLHDKTSSGKLLFQTEIEEWQIKQENSGTKVLLKFSSDFTKLVLLIGLIAIIIWDFLQE